MKKRLRKKKRLGEFVEYGFAVHFQLDLPEDKAEEWLERLIVETRGQRLELAGALGFPEAEGHFVVARLGGSGSVTDGEREAWLCRLESLPEVKLQKATGLVDVWHGDFGNEND